MKNILISILFTLLLQCNGDISQSINRQLPLNSLTSIPSPTQSLLPPTFENPIKDYTVGLIPPPIDGQSARDDTRPKVQQPQHRQNHIHSNSYTHSSGFINTARPFVNSVGRPHGYSAVHQTTHHSLNLLQPQVHQPKTAIYRPPQQFTTHHHPEYPSPKTYNAGIVRQPVAAVAQHHHTNFVSTPQYYNPVTQRRVHQHSTYKRYLSVPVQRAADGVKPTHPNVQKSASASLRPLSTAGSSIIQSYPSLSYTAIPQHGSTLNFGNAKLDPELVQIISEVYGQYH